MNYETSSDKFGQRAQTRSDRTVRTRDRAKSKSARNITMNFEPVNKLY